MSEQDAYLDDPALHPRLLAPAAAAELAGAWARSAGALRIDDVLQPGLAAELTALLGRFPLGLTSDEGVVWRCDVGIPAAVDPQHPEPLYRALRALDRDLPALAGAITGRPWRPARPGWLRLLGWRKGSWLERPAPRDGALHYLLGLTGARWPRDWGGWLALAGGESRPPGHDALDLLDDGQALALPLVLRHVEGLALTGALLPAGEEAPCSTQS